VVTIICMKKLSLTQSELMDILSYNTDTGVFTWKRSGLAAGTTSSGRYVQIPIKGSFWLGQRLAWLYTEGQFPPDDVEIDHIDRDKRNNRRINLRTVPHQLNCLNKISRKNISGYKGVRKNGNNWAATIQLDGKVKVLGTFVEKEIAYIVHCFASLYFRGDFAYCDCVTW